MLSPISAKCYLWCHIWPRGSDPKLLHPLSPSTTEIPHRIGSRKIPKRQPACLFLPLAADEQKHARLRRNAASVTRFDIAATNTALCAAKFIIALCHSVSLQFRRLSLLSYSLNVCACLHCSLSAPCLPAKVPRLPRLICGPFVSHGGSKGLLT